jgi:hypothetical protein
MPSVVLFDDLENDLCFAPGTCQLKVIRIEELGPRLDAAYDLLARVFDPAVLDSKETYVELLSPGGLRLDGFPVICVAAYFEHAGRELMAGFLSSNLMWIDREKKLLQLAIGNVATSLRLKEMGFRGVGTALLKAAIDIAGVISSASCAELAYSVAEAEAESLGFWRKFGYLWPKGLQYLQPPLEFDADGKPLHSEVPETFMIYPVGKRSRSVIETPFLRQMILAIYRNWCIEPNRRRLSLKSLASAEEYVMGKVFPRVDRCLHQSPVLPLTFPTAETATL